MGSAFRAGADCRRHSGATHARVVLDARAASDAAPRVAALLAEELQRSPQWQAEQVASFEKVARSFRLPAVEPLRAL